MKISIKTEWLNNNLGKNNLVLIDSSWYLPTQKRNVYEEYVNEHIPGSLFIDIDNLSDTSSNLPHMLPDIQKFEIYSQICGINKNSIVIIYDTAGIFSSPRLWWMFKYFGFSQVFILDGGLKKWKKENKILTSKVHKPKIGDFKPIERRKYLSQKENILKNLESNNTIIVDARSRDRFLGKEIEPRPGLKNGRIPNSKNLFWKKIINADGTLKTNKELKEVFKKLNLKKKKRIISTCGSGITACVLNIAFAKMNYNNISVYDGSWSEWGSVKNLPIV